MSRCRPTARPRRHRCTQRARRRPWPSRSRSTATTGAAAPSSGPVQPAEGDQRGADGGLRVDDDRAEPGPNRRPRRSARDQNTSDVGDEHDGEAGQHRALAQPGRLVLELVQAGAAGDEAVDRPADQAEHAQLLGRRRVDREPVGVVGVALRGPHLVGVAVPPDGALLQQPVRRQPAARQHDRRPPRQAEQHDRRRDARDHLHQTRRR